MAQSRENRAEDIYFLENFIDDSLITDEHCHRLFRAVITQSVKDAEKFSRTSADDNPPEKLASSVRWLKAGVSRSNILELAGITLEYTEKLEEIGNKATERDTGFFAELISKLDVKGEKSRKRL